MPSKYIDNTAIIQVIGCTFRNPELTEKYIITDEDFPNEFYRIVFGAIYKVYSLGAEKISLENISDFLSSRPKSEAIYKKEKGEEWLMRAVEACNPLSFDYYYKRLKKMSLLRAFDNCGVDVTDIYDPDNILDAKKKQLQEETLDNSTLEEIADRVNTKIDDIRMQYVDNSTTEAAQAGEGIFEIIDRFKQQPEVGVPLYGGLVNTITRGARLKKFYLRSAATGTGKAIPNSVTIPTPAGNKKVGDIKVGDYLFGQDGKPTKVIAVHPQPEPKEIWRITFSDNKVAECCSEHLWEIYDSKTEGPQVKTVDEIYTTMCDYMHRPRSGGMYQVKVRINRPAEYPAKKYKLPPYAMGALVSRIQYKFKNQTRRLYFCAENPEVVQAVCDSLGDYIYSPAKDYPDTYIFRKKTYMGHIIELEDIFNNYPELLQLNANNRVLPSEYLYGSIPQREELLAGLMDASGEIDKFGRCVFNTSSSYLKDNVIELCRSLGYLTSCEVETHYDGFNKYSVIIPNAPSEIFSIKSKRKGYKEQNVEEFSVIRSIEATGKMAEMTCFTVDNESHLFLMNDYIVTHNTRSMVGDACYIGCNKIYDETFGWIKTGAAQPTLFITTEQELEEIQTMMLAFLSNVNETHILNGQYEEGEEERVLEAARVLKSSPLYIEDLPDFSLQDVENTIKKNIREHDVKYVFDSIERVSGQ